jgi:transporter family-2 protein
MFHLPHALTMLAAGVGIPILAALNAQFGQRLGSPALAAAVLFVVAFGCALLVTLATGTGMAARLLEQPRHLYLAGVLVAFYVLSITYIAPTFGVGNAVFFVLLGQLVSAALIDHFGLMGARPAPLSALRAGGIGLMALGVLLTQRA